MFNKIFVLIKIQINVTFRFLNLPVVPILHTGTHLPKNKALDIMKSLPKYSTLKYRGIKEELMIIPYFNPVMKLYGCVEMCADGWKECRSLPE